MPGGVFVNTVNISARVAAIDKAIEIGVDYVEVDVRETKDGHLICMHDGDVDRTTDGEGEVRDLDLAYIRGLDAGSWFSEEFAGQRVPIFEEVLEHCRMAPGDVDLISAHGTSTPLGDAVEAQAIESVFGSARPWVMSTKSMTWVIYRSELMNRVRRYC